MDDCESSNASASTAVDQLTFDQLLKLGSDHLGRDVIPHLTDVAQQHRARVDHSPLRTDIDHLREESGHVVEPVYQIDHRLIRDVLGLHLPHGFLPLCSS